MDRRVIIRLRKRNEGWNDRSIIRYVRGGGVVKNMGG